jgi:hypothetical protein
MDKIIPSEGGFRDTLSNNTITHTDNPNWLNYTSPNLKLTIDITHGWIIEEISNRFDTRIDFQA